MSVFSVYKTSMYFQSLDNAPKVPALTLAYRFTDNTGEAWTQRINRFKSGDPAAIAGACRAMERMLSNMEIKASVVMAGAIPSGATHLPATAGVYMLGQHLSNALGFTWHPQLLTKRTHRKLHDIYNASERDAEVAGAYVATALPTNHNLVIILDDLITRGSTLNSAASAVWAVAPDVKIVGLAPGKTERQAYWADRGSPISNDHVPVELAQAWDTV